MRIIFLCGSLEPGKDGVGDYCQRLAIELTRYGHKTGLLSISEGDLHKSMETKLMVGDNNSIPVLRLQDGPDVNTIFHHAKKWIEIFNPDWISLQFVIFSFHPKGLPFGLSQKFLKIAGKWRWHIMFHELWLGLNSNRSVKFLLWGYIQKKIIAQIITAVKPSVIHTHTRLYQAELEKLGYATGYLPLFGNIPFSKNASAGAVTTEHLKYPRAFKMVIFGTIHKVPQVNTFAREVAGYADKSNRLISLIIVGISGPEKEEWKTAFETAGLQIECLGIQDAENISNIFADSDIGISTNPIQFAEKSGTIAAMREHGLPILCIPEPVKTSARQTFQTIEGVFQYYPGNFGVFVENAQKLPLSSNVEFAAAELIRSFNKKKGVLIHK